MRRWLYRLVEKDQMGKAGIRVLTVEQVGRNQVWTITLAIPTGESESVPAVAQQEAQESESAQVQGQVSPEPVESRDVEQEIAAIRERLGADIGTRVEKAWARYLGGLRVGTTPQPQAALRHFWQPALELLELVEEKGGSQALLTSAITETTSRALGVTDQRPQTFVSYTRTIVNNGLGKAGRNWQTNAEKEKDSSPETLAYQVSNLLRECMEPVSKGNKSKAAIGAVRALFKEMFPSELRKKVAETFFDGNQRRSDACLTLAIKQGDASFKTVTPEEATTINFLPDWRWPVDLKTNRQFEDEKRDEEILRQAEEEMPSWEEIQQAKLTPSSERARAKALLTGNPTLAS